MCGWSHVGRTTKTVGRRGRVNLPSTRQYDMVVHMKKSKLNPVIDFLIFIFFTITAVAGFFLHIFMSHRARTGGVPEFLGLHKGVWLHIHVAAGILLTILVIVHLILHWNWVVCMFRNAFSSDKCNDGTT